MFCKLLIINTLRLLMTGAESISFINRWLIPSSWLYSIPSLNQFHSTSIYPDHLNLNLCSSVKCIVTLPLLKTSVKHLFYTSIKWGIANQPYFIFFSCSWNHNHSFIWMFLFYFWYCKHCFLREENPSLQNSHPGKISK